jgi:hypothetical protein
LQVSLSGQAAEEKGRRVGITVAAVDLLMELIGRLPNTVRINLLICCSVTDSATAKNPKKITNSLYFSVP